MPVRTKLNAPPRDDPRDALPRLDRFKPKCGPVAKSKNSRWRAIVLVSVYLLVGLHVVHWLLAGRTITPVEPSEAMQTLEGGYVNAGAILFVLLIASTLVFGRWFCGWACHIVALQDLCAWLLGRLGLRPRPVRSRLLILVPFAAALYMFAWPTVHRWLMGGAAPALDWSQIATDDLWRTFPGPWMALITFLVCGFLIVWWLGAKGFCSYGCPYGAIFAVADRFAAGRIRVTDACEHCGHCTSVCTSNVRVHEEVAKHGMVVDPGCMKCMDCVSVCPKDALYFGFGGIAPLQVSQQRRAARADFSWGEELLLAVVGFASFQWVWRGTWLIEPVPFLLAIGLAVITAVCALLGVRLVLRREVGFQHAALKRGGRLTARGRWAAAALVAGYGFAGVLAVGNLLGRRAFDAATDPIRAVMQGTHPPRADAEQAQAAAALALRWSLGRDPRLLDRQGLMLRELERHDEAERALAEAVRRAPDQVTDVGTVALAIYLQRSGRIGDALALARTVLERSTRMGHPNRTAQVLVEQLGGR